MAALVCAYPAVSQSTASTPARVPKGAVQVRAVAVQHEPEGTAVEITSTGSLVPAITKLNGPPRLVIDLPESVNAVRHPLGPEASDIRGVRVNQFQQDPPVTRVVIDLVEPRSYFWEMLQNKLVIHLRRADASEAADAAQPSSGSDTQGLQAVSSAAVVDGSAAVLLAGTRIVPGSSITAGQDTTILTLTRGGQVRVCPGTTISVTPSQNGRELMLGMSTGSIEAHYRIDSSADSVLTPDFRILLTGPGEFHYAFSADSKGNTCVRSLPGNQSSAVVSELIGDGVYKLKPDEEVVFRAGQLAKTDDIIPGDCGCPTEREPVLRAEADIPKPVSQTVSVSPETPMPTPQPVAANPAGIQNNPTAPPSDPTLPVAQTAEAKPAQAHIFIQAPLVFRASDPPPAPVRDARRLPSVSRHVQTQSAAVGAPAGSSSTVPVSPNDSTSPAKQEKEARGFFGSLKHFFAKIFG